MNTYEQVRRVIDEYFIVKPDAICTANDAYRIYAESKSGNMTKTARALGLTPRQVSWRVRKYGIEPRDFKPDRIKQR